MNKKMSKILFSLFFFYGLSCLLFSPLFSLDNSYFSSELFTKEFTSELKNFSKIYQSRPIITNSGEMRSPDQLSLFFILKKISPNIVIESGVWHGLSTWTIRQAIDPSTTIICLDPLDTIIYRDQNAKYYIEKNFVDFQDLEIQQNPCDKILAFFDDHIDAFERLIQCYNKGIKYVFFNDNYPPGFGSHLTLNQIIKGHSKHANQKELLEKKMILEKIIETYFIFPNVFSFRTFPSSNSTFLYHYTNPKRNNPFYRIYYNEADYYRWNTFVELKTINPLK